MKIQSSQRFLAKLAARRRFRAVRILPLTAVLAAVGFADHSSQAASQTWSGGGTDTNWGDAANWANDAVPGGTGAITNDIATFSAALVNGTKGGSTDPVILNATYSIGGITFTGAGVGAYQIGATGGTTALVLSTIATAVGTHQILLDTSAGASQVIAAPLTFVQPSSTNGFFGFTSNATSSAVTLTLSGSITAGSATGRPVNLVLDGTNTGANAISGAINSQMGGQAGAFITKNGSGTWNLTGNNTFAANTNSGPFTSTGSFIVNAGTLNMTGNNTFSTTSRSGANSNLNFTVNGGTVTLSGANAFTGPAATVASTTNGFIVNNGGLLVAENNAALGTNATANANVNNYINNGGILELNSSSANGSITLDDGLVLTLNSGGTIRSNGSNATNSRISVGTAASTSATLATVNAGDVFTVGNATNDFTGGASDSVVHVAGPGMVALNQASSYAGTVSVDAGTLQLNSPTAIGAATTASIAFGANSTGRLQLNGTNVTVVGFNSNTAVGTPVVENGGLSDAVLTVNNTSANTYGGVLQDGNGNGALLLTKGGTGTLTLSGANTYTGATTIGAGVLNVTGSLGNGTAVVVNSGGTLAGRGTVAGAVTVSGGGIVSPGNGGTGTVGTLSINNLTLNAGSQLNYDLTNTTTLDRITVTGAGGLTINGGQFNLNGASSVFSANGVYNLIGYSGAIGGTGVSALTLNANNQNTSTNSYTFGTAGGFVTLTVAATGVTADYWNVDANGNWGTASNWTAGVPNAAGAFAAFGGSGTTITAPRTVTVNGAYTVGTLAFNSAQAYTLAAGAGGQLTLDNGTSAAFVTDSAGSQFIAVPLAMTANGAGYTVSTATDTLSVSGVVSGGGVLTKNGAGTLALTGANTYTGGTIINAGTVQINSATSLGNPSGVATLNAATLEATADITSPRNFVLGSTTSTILVDAAHTYAISGVLADGASAGTLVKSGAGILALNGANTYTGGTTISAGTVQINSASSLGSAASGTAATLGAATLEATAAFTTGSNFTLNDAASTLAVDTGVTTVATGTFSGSGALNKTGAGTLTLTGANTYTGSTVLTGGVISVGNGGTTGSLGTGSIVFQGGTFTNSYNNNDANSLGQAISVAAGQTGTINMGNRFVLGGAITGAGTLNVNAATTVTRDDFSNNWAGFTGQLNVAGSGTIRLLANGGSFVPGSLVSTSVDLEGTVALQPSNNSAGNTYSMGALSGTSTTTTLAGPSQGGATTWSIGALNTNTTFAGVIASGIVTKVGTGTLTLTAANQYAGGTTISAGTLNINGVNALGGANYAGLTINGGALQYNAAASTANNGSLDVSNIGGTPEPVTIGASGATIDTNGNAVTFANTIGNSGAGGLVKAGTGTLTLAAANTYTGGTTVNAGILTLTTGTLGTGNVTVANTTGATLVLGNNTAIADSATLIFGTNSAVQMNASGSETLAAITDSISGVTINTAGVYSATTLNTDFGVSSFSGSETFTIAAVPEPGTLATLLLSVAGMGAVLRRRKSAGKDVAA